VKASRRGSQQAPAIAHQDYRPQLASLVKTPPSGDQWLHEIKLDGYRVGCRIENGDVTLISRSGRDWTATFPEIVEAARGLKLADALMDGELVMLQPDGRTSFEALQQAVADRAARAPLVYSVFDLLRLDGERVDRLPLEQRKTQLEALLGRGATGRIRYTDHIEGHGRAFFDEACRLGLEGIVSKRRDLPYLPGRGDSWQKTKCLKRGLFVVGGYTDPTGSRAGIGAILVGRYEGERLVFAGRVGTGFSQSVALGLRRRFDALERRECPFTPPPAGPLARHAHWVTPALVCEASFIEWTEGGMLRHPSFQGLRDGIKPSTVMIRP